MSEETTSNGSQGRFLRIEEKLDGLVDDFGDFRVDIIERLARLETKQGYTQERVSMNTYKWMRVGIIASFALGAVSIGIRMVWG